MKVIHHNGVAVIMRLKTQWCSHQPRLSKLSSRTEGGTAFHIYFSIGRICISEVTGKSSSCNRVCIIPLDHFEHLSGGILKTLTLNVYEIVIKTDLFRNAHFPVF